MSDFRVLGSELKAAEELDRDGLAAWSAPAAGEWSKLTGALRTPWSGHTVVLLVASSLTAKGANEAMLLTRPGVREITRFPPGSLPTGTLAADYGTSGGVLSRAPGNGTSRWCWLGAWYHAANKSVAKRVTCPTAATDDLRLVLLHVMRGGGRGVTVKRHGCKNGAVDMTPDFISPRGFRTRYGADLLYPAKILNCMPNVVPLAIQRAHPTNHDWRPDTQWWDAQLAADTEAGQAIRAVHSADPLLVDSMALPLIAYRSVLAVIGLNSQRSHVRWQEEWQVDMLRHLQLRGQEAKTALMTLMRSRGARICWPAEVRRLVTHVVEEPRTSERTCPACREDAECDTRRCISCGACEWAASQHYCPGAVLSVLDDLLPTSARRQRASADGPAFMRRDGCYVGCEHTGMCFMAVTGSRARQAGRRQSSDVSDEDDDSEPEEAMYTYLDWLLGQHGGAWTTRLGIPASRAGRLQSGRPRLTLADVANATTDLHQYVAELTGVNWPAVGAADGDGVPPQRTPRGRGASEWCGYTGVELHKLVERVSRFTVRQLVTIAVASDTLTE